VRCASHSPEPFQFPLQVIFLVQNFAFLPDGDEPALNENPANVIGISRLLIIFWMHKAKFFCSSEK
jgi:hypothetical protein